MTKPKKKHKTGDVVGWGVIDCDGDRRSHEKMETREMARRRQQELYALGDAYHPFKIVKIVLAK